MSRAAGLILAACLAGLSAGCVTRRVMITSDPPAAAVYRNGVFIGTTPVSEPFVYYGNYNYRLVHDGYEPLDVRQELKTPWYEIPGVDFVSENLIPYPFRDVQRFHYQLQPERPVRVDEIRASAEQLKAQGAAVQPVPSNRTNRANASPAPSQAPAPVLPPPTPAPSTAPQAAPPVNVPSVGPVARSPAGT